MLAQNFKTATDLGITETEVAALISVLNMLERGEIPPQQFNMSDVLYKQRGCGTVACLCGWAYVVSNKEAFPEVKAYLRTQWLKSERFPVGLLRLFRLDAPTWSSRDISQDHAAAALRNYLTHGEPLWDEVMA